MKRSRSHALGQHFLHNPRILKKIADLISPAKNDLVIEIGAGKGALTRLLAAAAGTVIAIEKDSRLIPDLQRLGLDNVIIREQDVLKFDFVQATKGKPVLIAGNLPYAISTPFLYRLLDVKSICREGHFLLQKEVAERACASHGTKRSAPLSLLLQNEFEVSIRLKVAPGSFTPPPQVDSAFVSFYKRPAPLFPEAAEVRFQKFLHVCFQQRRKKLTNNLKSLGLSNNRMNQGFAQTGIAPEVRSEQLSLQQFVDLYQALML
jgi:16S rRNA (adenine1518-N6/adenine1519-N6)-dimethyltransferase